MEEKNHCNMTNETTKVLYIIMQMSYVTLQKLYKYDHKIIHWKPVLRYLLNPIP
jgi:hypothetical protein